MSERPRLLVLDLLESFARERDVDVWLDRRNDRQEWVCVLQANSAGDWVAGSGQTAREAILNALKGAGAELPS